jgi:hypothetical protein
MSAIGGKTDIVLTVADVSLPTAMSDRQSPLHCTSFCCGYPLNLSARSSIIGQGLRPQASMALIFTPQSRQSHEQSKPRRPAEPGRPTRSEAWSAATKSRTGWPAAAGRPETRTAGTAKVVATTIMRRSVKCTAAHYFLSRQNAEGGEQNQCGF